MLDSIRIKLTLWYVGILAIFMIAFASVTYFAIIRGLNSETNERLIEMSRNFASALAAEQDDIKDNQAAESAIRETTNEMRFRDYQFVVLDNKGLVVGSTEGFNYAPPANDVGTGFVDIALGETPFRLYQKTLTTGSVTYRLLVYHSLEEQTTFENRLARIFSIALPLALLCAGFGGYFLARKSLAPVIKMEQKAQRISAANLDERLPVGNERDELGKLSIVFNALLERLQNAFEQQRRFTADASHELRTPLAIVRGESEVAISRTNRKPEDYRASLAIVHDESKRMTRIVDDLLTLARADAGQMSANLVPVYLDEIVGDCVRSIRVLAEIKGIDVEFTTDGEMPMNGDEDLLHRLFLNLLENAVKFNRPSTPIVVNCLIEPQIYRVSISDSGVGIPQAEQSHIFDRFYRADKARSRSLESTTSGAGLGLSIAKWIVTLHGGTIEVVSSDEKGSVFAVAFPR